MVDTVTYLSSPLHIDGALMYPYSIFRISDIINTNSWPVGFLEECQAMVVTFCDDMHEDAAKLLRHAVSVYSWCVATGRRLQRGEDSAHYADGAKSAMEWADGVLEDVGE